MQQPNYEIYPFHNFLQINRIFSIQHNRLDERNDFVDVWKELLNKWLKRKGRQIYLSSNNNVVTLDTSPLGTLLILPTIY
jgi:hypothetical protein